MSGCSSGVEHNLAKVGVERSNRFTRSKFPHTEKPRTSAVFSFSGRLKGPGPCRVVVDPSGCENDPVPNLRLHDSSVTWWRVSAPSSILLHEAGRKSQDAPMALAHPVRQVSGDLFPESKPAGQDAGWACGHPVDARRRHPAWQAVDVTSLVSDDQKYVGFVLTTTSAKGVAFASRETRMHGPRLVVEREDDTTTSTATTTTGGGETPQP